MTSEARKNIFVSFQKGLTYDTLQKVNNLQSIKQECLESAAPGLKTFQMLCMLFKRNIFWRLGLFML